MPLADNMKFIRSGVLSKHNDNKNTFEECQLKLHHDYLTFYKFKETGMNLLFREKDIFHASVELTCGDNK